MENKKCQTSVIELINKHLAFFLRDPAGTQTQDPQLRRLLLYSAELPNQTFWKTEYSPYSRKIFYVAFSTIVDCECKGNNFFVALQKKNWFFSFCSHCIAELQLRVMALRRSPFMGSRI